MIVTQPEIPTTLEITKTKKARKYSMKSYVFDDGGRSKSEHKNETRDCTVRAVAICFGLTYDRAHEIMRGLGRKNRNGFQMRSHLNGVVSRSIPEQRRFLDKEITRIETKYEMMYEGKTLHKKKTLSKFAKENPKGIFILCSSGHVSSLVDGTLRDTWNHSRTQLFTAFKIG